MGDLEHQAKALPMDSNAILAEALGRARKPGMAQMKLQFANRPPSLTWRPSVKDVEYPTRFKVPHFGADDDRVATRKHYDPAETRMGHKRNITDPSKDPDRKKNYFVLGFGAA